MATSAPMKCYLKLIQHVQKQPKVDMLQIMPYNKHEPNQNLTHDNTKGTWNHKGIKGNHVKIQENTP